LRIGKHPLNASIFSTLEGDIVIGSNCRRKKGGKVEATQMCTASESKEKGKNWRNKKNKGFGKPIAAYFSWPD